MVFAPKAPSPPRGDQGRRKKKKEDALEMLSASPIFYAWEAAYRDSQHLIPVTLKYLHDCFRFTSQSPPYYVNQTAGPYSEHPCQSVSPLRLHDVSEAEDVEPGSGKTILFLLCGDTAALIPRLANLTDRNFVCNFAGSICS